MNLQEKINIVPQIIENFDKVIYGQANAKKELIKWFLANEHLIIESLPWLGKTELVKILAESTWLDYKRIQWTPDLMPQDILWYTNIKGIKIEWTIMTNILLIDEINRINPKTLSALLSAMSEKLIVDIDTWEHKPLPDDFLVIATQNPIETIGTFELPEATKDRFAIKIKLIKEENTLIQAYNLNKDNIPCNISNNLLQNINTIFDNLDSKISNIELIKKNLINWPSIRAWLQFIKIAKVTAFIEWRDFVIIDDIIKNIIPVFFDKINLLEDYEFNWWNKTDLLNEYTKEIEKILK